MMDIIQFSIARPWIESQAIFFPTINLSQTSQKVHCEANVIRFTRWSTELVLGHLGLKGDASKFIIYYNVTTK